jgi:hypothetical protein
LEEIRQTVVNSKQETDLWQLGRKAEPYLSFLAEKWDDPRSEEILAQLAKTGPQKTLGELTLQTLALAAEEYLQLLQANRDFAQMMKDANTPEARLKQIRAYFVQNPTTVPQRLSYHKTCKNGRRYRRGRRH